MNKKVVSIETVEWQPMSTKTIDITPNYSAIFSMMLKQFEMATENLAKIPSHSELLAAYEPLSYVSIALSAISSTAELETLRNTVSDAVERLNRQLIQLRED